VFSKTLAQVGSNCQLFRGNIPEEINQLRAQPGKDVLVGGRVLASTFMKLGGIDEYGYTSTQLFLEAENQCFRPWATEST